MTQPLFYKNKDVVYALLRRIGWIMAFMLFLAPIRVNAQHQQVSLNLKNAKLEQAIEQLSSQSKLGVAFSKEMINTDQLVTIALKNVTLADALNQLLAKTEIGYKISNGKIYLFDKGKEVKSENTRKGSKTVRVKGVVTDIHGEPLPGVNIVDKSTNKGTITDIDGNYVFELPGEAQLTYSYIGYTPQVMKVNNREVLNVRLAEDSKTLNEVVVVGYGTQKKPNLTGSVSMINNEDLASRPTSNVANALQGMLPGVTVSNFSAQPGSAASSIKVRGLGTIGNANPLILIDGVEGNINILNPEDIESISVLKDAASASIYGARGANGVILVTTKKVMSKQDAAPAVSFSGYFGLQSPTRKPEMASAAEYMMMEAEARMNVGQAPTYTENDLRKVILGTDPNYFANTDWVSQLYRSTAPQQNYSVNINGSNKNIGYYFSYSYFDQEGLTVGNSTGSQRNNFRLKLNTVIAERLDVSANMSYTDRTYKGPSGSLANDGGAIYQAMRISPLIPVYFTDNKWGYGGGSANPVSMLYDSGYNKFDSQEFSGNFSAKLKITNDLNATATYSLVKTNSLRKILTKTINYYYPHTDEVWYTANTKNKYENRDYADLMQTLIVQGNYDKQIGDHSISVLGGFSQEWSLSENFNAYRTDLISEDFENLESGSKIAQFNSAAASQWAIRSGFGRLNYNFQEKYLLEANLRYDLSSRFAKNNRSKLYPSFSAGWRATEESFMEPLRKHIDNLKVRASWGILGNQYVGSSNYPYMTSIASVNVPTIGGVLNDGYMQSGLPNPNLRWETINMLNIGLDLGFLANRLTISGDWYDKKTKDILLKLTYPGVLGTEPTEVNAGVVNNRGWEVDVRWNDKVGKVKYGLGFNLSDVKNKIVSLAGSKPSIGDYNIRMEGAPINAFYGLVADGLASVNDFERYNSASGRYEGPKFPVLDSDKSLVQPGDIKYKDINGDGKLTLENDRKQIGSDIPRYTYTFSGNAEYKGLDFSFIIQGVGKADGYVTGAGRHAFIDQSSYPQKLHRDRWTMENQNPNASYPRFTMGLDYNQRFSTFWMEDASYLRLKNIQLGYSLPSNLTKKARISRCRFYMSADNLLTFSDFFRGYDPETPVTKGGYYPQVKTFVFGVNLTFK